MRCAGKEIEKSCQGIYPLQNTFVRKVKLLRAPKFDLNKLMEVGGGGWRRRWWWIGCGAVRGGEQQHVGGSVRAPFTEGLVVWQHSRAWGGGSCVSLDPCSVCAQCENLSRLALTPYHPPTHAACA